MSKAPALAVVPPSPPKPDPAAAHETARKTLGEAVALHQEAQAKLKSNADAQAYAKRLRLEAFTGLEETEKALDDAKADLGRLTAEAVLSGAKELPTLESFHA